MKLCRSNGRYIAHQREASCGNAEFLAEPGTDPRGEFIRTLLEELSGRSEPIAVYSGYEQQILAALAKTFPEKARQIESVIDRLVDLLPIVRSSIYMKKFQGSFSIKSVAPALTGLDYSDLTVADGGEASSLFEQLHAGGLPVETIAEARSHLLAYCRKDTLALVGVHKRLRALAA